MRTFAALILSCAIAGAAALVPVPGPKAPALPLAGFEANRGQAKPEVLFLSRGNPNLAITAQAILYSPLGVRLGFVASHPNPAVRFTDPLPGVANSFTGPDTQKWVTGIPRYATAHLAGIYPGIDAQYAIDTAGQVTLRLLVAPGADPRAVVFEFPEATEVTLTPDGSVRAQFGPLPHYPTLLYPAPVAFQEAGRISRGVSFEVLPGKRFSFQVAEHDATLPLRVEMTIGRPIAPSVTSDRPRPVMDAGGNVFVAAAIADAAGKDAPFPNVSRLGSGCEPSVGHPFPCSDVALYKFSGDGQLVYVSYLAGRTREQATALHVAPDGLFLLTGSTDSSDFPVTAALQPVYGGPAATSSGSGSRVAGDLFAAKLDPASGLLGASTYLGGPDADSVGETVLGADGSLYFIPGRDGRPGARMPVSPNAVQAECMGDPCANGYAAHISPALDRLIFGTYLPGRAQATAKLHSDGSIYYAGAAQAGFLTTPSAYQREAAGEYDGIVARLDPRGSSLMFATYIGGPENDSIFDIALAPDGTVWASVSAPADVQHRLVRLGANGERILAEKRINVADLAVDREGNLHAIAAGTFTVGPDAFLANPCGGGLAYLKLSPSGEQLFASYLPGGQLYEFDGTSERGMPLLNFRGEPSELVEGQSMGVFAGCVVDAASFVSDYSPSPGAIVTLFGSRMGPREGVAFQLENGRVPTALAGTQVLVNGEPVPILFASYWQVNAILPYSLPQGTRPKIQVVSNGAAGNELTASFVQRAAISLFRADASPVRPAAALNADGTLNSPRNPARPGSTVVLFGTGGGSTVPPSVAGEVTPLVPRPLEFGAEVQIAMPNGPRLPVEYAGGAPGQVAGVTQINVRLPDTIPEVPGFPRGTLPLLVITPGVSFYPGHVTVSVAVN